MNMILNKVSTLKIFKVFTVESVYIDGTESNFMEFYFIYCNELKD